MANKFYRKIFATDLMDLLHSTRYQVKYNGNKYYCPCCGHSFKQMVSFPLFVKEFSNIYDLSHFPAEKQAIFCPVCRSLPRHRLIAAYLEKGHNLEALRQGLFLFFAPEQGLSLFLKRNNIHYIGADLNSPEVSLHINMQEMPFKDSSISTIMCNHVLEHVDDYQATLKEIYRVLTPGGQLLFTVPMNVKSQKTLEDKSAVTPAQRFKLYAQVDHLRLFGRDLPAAVTAAGFNVDIIKGDDYPANLLTITGPCDYDINWLFVCRCRK